MQRELVRDDHEPQFRNASARSKLCLICHGHVHQIDQCVMCEWSRRSVLLDLLIGIIERMYL